MAGTTEPTMNLDLPGVGLGGDTELVAWTKIIQDLLKIAAHDHTTGKGVQIGSAGLNINDTVQMQGFSLQNLRSNIFQDQTSALTDNTSLFVVNGDLKYRNTAGTLITITSGSSLGTAFGTITGLGSGGSSGALSGDTLSFNWDTAKRANLAVGEVRIHNSTDTSGSYVGLSVAAGTFASYSLTLPQILPTSNDSALLLTTSGVGSYAKVPKIDPTITANRPVYIDATNTLQKIELANGALIIGSGGGFSTAVPSGTANQVTVTPGAGTLTFSLPQDIATSSTPSFSRLTLTDTGGTSLTAVTASLTGALTVAGNTVLGTFPGASVQVVGTGGLQVTGAALTAAQGLGVSNGMSLSGNLTGVSANAISFGMLGGASTFTVSNGKTVLSNPSLTALEVAAGNSTFAGFTFLNGGFQVSTAAQFNATVTGTLESATSGSGLSFSYSGSGSPSFTNTYAFLSVQRINGRLHFEGYYTFTVSGSGLSGTLTVTSPNIPLRAGNFSSVNSAYGVANFISSALAAATGREAGYLLAATGTGGIFASVGIAGNHAGTPVVLAFSGSAAQVGG